jgi:hypothetical protein
MGREFNIPCVRGSIYHGYGDKIPWVKGSIYDVYGVSKYYG